MKHITILLLLLIGGCANYDEHDKLIPAYVTGKDGKTGQFLDIPTGEKKPEITRVEFDNHLYIVVYKLDMLAMTHDPDCKCLTEEELVEKEDYGY